MTRITSYVGCLILSALLCVTWLALGGTALGAGVRLTVSAAIGVLTSAFWLFVLEPWLERRRRP